MQADSLQFEPSSRKGGAELQVGPRFPNSPSFFHMMERIRRNLSPLPPLQPPLIFLCTFFSGVRKTQCPAALGDISAIKPGQGKPVAEAGAGEAGARWLPTIQKLTSAQPLACCTKSPREWTENHPVTLQEQWFNKIRWS